MALRSNLRAASIAALLACAGATPALAQNCDVKLGVAGPMSGGAAAWGLAEKAAADFVATFTNQEGGLKVGDRKCQVRVFSFDSQYTAAGGAAASNYMASENVHVVIGPVGSPETVGFRPVAKRHGQVSFSVSYLRDVIGPEFPLVFHTTQAPVTWGPLLVKTAAEQFKFKSVIIVGANDQGGTDGTKQLVTIYENLGVKASPEYFQRGTTNFGPIATRIMNANPDAVDMATMPPADAEVLVKALTDAGYKGVYGSMGGVGINPVVQGAGGVDKIKGYYWLEIAPLDHPGTIRMKAEYQKIMKTAAPEVSLFPAFVTSAEVALHAISVAGTDQDAEKIADALRKSTPESRFMGKAGWRGKSIYGINQELSFPTGMGMIVNGKKLPVRTIEIPTEH
jgi:branched-chain amino acid transport system substrate-binding protein